MLKPVLWIGIVLMPIQIFLFRHRSRYGFGSYPVYFYSQRLQCFIFLISVKGVKIFFNLDSILKFIWKKFSLSLLFAKMDTYPDPAKLCRSDWIRIHNTGWDDLSVTIPACYRWGRLCCEELERVPPLWVCPGLAGRRKHGYTGG